MKVNYIFNKNAFEVFYIILHFTKRQCSKLWDFVFCFVLLLVFLMSAFLCIRCCTISISYQKAIMLIIRHLDFIFIYQFLKLP